MVLGLLYASNANSLELCFAGSPDSTNIESIYLNVSDTTRTLNNTYIKEIVGLAYVVNQAHAIPITGIATYIDSKWNALLYQGLPVDFNSQTSIRFQSIGISLIKDVNLIDHGFPGDVSTSIGQARLDQYDITDDWTYTGGTTKLWNVGCW